MYSPTQKRTELKGAPVQIRNISIEINIFFEKLHANPHCFKP
jgi:hypothetical protein